MYSKKGFTVIELLTVTFVLCVAAILVWSQINHIEVAARDDKRRTAINAMYYNLEEVFYPQNKYYPRTIDEKVLVAMDKDLFTDPKGNKIGAGASNYRYEPTNCNGDSCQGYSLRADLEAEADYVKTNRSR